MPGRNVIGSQPYFQDVHSPWLTPQALRAPVRSGSLPGFQDALP
jgi:hypothetical protein